MSFRVSVNRQHVRIENRKGNWLEPTLLLQTEHNFYDEMLSLLNRKWRAWNQVRTNQLVRTENLFEQKVTVHTKLCSHETKYQWRNYFVANTFSNFCSIEFCHSNDICDELPGRRCMSPRYLRGNNSSQKFRSNKYSQRLISTENATFVEWQLLLVMKTRI